MNMDKVWAFLKAHWPAFAASAVAFLTAAWSQFGTDITAYIQAHPKYSLAYSLVAFVVAYYLKSPRQAKP